MFDGAPAVSIYRDYDDGLYGRSLYRGVVFSVKLESFSRYRSLPVPPGEGLTAYLVSRNRAEDLAAGRVRGVTSAEPVPGSLPERASEEAEKKLFVYNRDGLQIAFSLERVSQEILDEIGRTYPGNLPVSQSVSDSYRGGFVVRVHTAENVYRPEYSEIDYEDVLIAASFAGDRFQPLWGIHDGNALNSGTE
jgi:hypothetical protein